MDHDDAQATREVHPTYYEAFLSQWLRGSIPFTRHPKLDPDRTLKVEPDEFLAIMAYAVRIYRKTVQNTHTEKRSSKDIDWVP